MTVGHQLEVNQDCFCTTDTQLNDFGRLAGADDLALLGHEIRNPLSALTYALQAWATTKGDQQLEQQLLQIMQRQVKQLTRLCDDLLDGGKCAKGILSIQPSLVDIRKSIQSAIEEVQPKANSYGHTLTFELGDRPLMLMGDESRLTQVFANLLHNSVKFTPTDGRLHITLERDNHDAIIKICDNGRGMSAELQRHLFTPGKSPVLREDVVGRGLGLGLQLAKAIVKLHHGSLEAFSEGLGHGSTFVVKLPRPANLSYPIQQNRLLSGR